MSNQIAKIRQIIRQILIESKYVPLSRDKTSNSISDYFDVIDVEDSTLKDFYIVKQIDKNGEEITQIYRKNEDGSKGDYLYSINSDINNSNLHIDYSSIVNHKNNKNKPY